MGAIPRSTWAIGADVRSLGLAQVDLVMVHASPPRIGPVEGGADGVIDAIRLATDAADTMRMILGAADAHE